MNRKWMLVASSVCFCANLSIAGPVALSATESVRALKLPGELGMSKNESLSANYAETECFDVAMKKSGEVLGIICGSRSNDFLRDMGISEFDSLPESARPVTRPRSGLLISTPMGQYEMKAQKNIVTGTVAAEVDCDLGNNPIYRAMATCHVAIAKRGPNEVIYTNFNLKNHISKKRGVGLKFILNLWQQLNRE